MGDDVAPGDRVPTPPGSTDQGLPPRPFPYAPLPGVVRWLRTSTLDADGRPVIAMIYDDPSTRTVSYWSESSFRDLAERMVAFVNGEATLTVADMADLRALVDPSPIIDPKDA